MVTPDKRLAQLVSEAMYKPARMGNGIEIWVFSEDYGNRKDQNK
jgi:hypothetical protein